MSHEALSRHTIYNNRFRASSSGSGLGSGDSDNAPDGAVRAHQPTAVHGPTTLPLHHRQPQPLHVIQETEQQQQQQQHQQPLDLFGQTPLEWAVDAMATSQSPRPLSPQSPAGESRGGDFYLRLHSSERAGQAAPGTASGAEMTGEVDLNFRPPAPPAAPGKPRRVSRGSSSSSAAAGRRQQFAASRYSTSSNSSLCGTGAAGVDGGCGSIDGKRIVTSTDSAFDEVFADPHHEGYGHHQRPVGSPGGDWSLFPQPAGGHVRTQISSTSSTTSMLPNPYNSVNHRLHSCLWCCSCLYFVFFCCLPAIHFMEQSDMHHRNNNLKAARRLGTASTFLFLLGTLITFAVFGLVFFLVIYFAVH